MTNAAGTMTLEELQRIVLMLSNSAYVRWWAHWNYPQQTPWIMALRVSDEAPDALESDLLARGFRKVVLDNMHYWLIDRIDEQGRAFRSEL